jgi:hypothetical protein
VLTGPDATGEGPAGASARSERRLVVSRGARQADSRQCSLRTGLPAHLAGDGDDINRPTRRTSCAASSTCLTPIDHADFK